MHVNINKEKSNWDEYTPNKRGFSPGRKGDGGCQGQTVTFFFFLLRVILFCLYFNKGVALYLYVI